MVDIWRSDHTVDGAELESAFGVSATCAHLALEGDGSVVEGSVSATAHASSSVMMGWLVGLAMHVGIFEDDAIRFFAPYRYFLCIASRQCEVA